MTLVNNATGAPAVTPQQLSIIAIGELIIPDLQPRTAPPRGQDGLVGPAGVVLGPPRRLGPGQPDRDRRPGVGQGDRGAQRRSSSIPAAACPASRATGPGTAYQPALAPGAQHTDCSYTYDQPSAGQPGNAYRRR